MKKITIIAITLSLIVFTSCKSREDELKEQMEILDLEMAHQHSTPDDSTSKPDMSLSEYTEKADSLRVLLIEEKTRKLRK